MVDSNTALAYARSCVQPELARETDSVQPDTGYVRSPRPLTARQQSILDWIVRYIDTNEYPPTNREIGAAFGIRSTNGVNDHLKALERKGFILRDERTSRGMHVLQLPKSTELDLCPHCGQFMPGS